MKHNIICTIIGAFATAMFFSACEKQVPSAPVVTLLEVGHENSHSAFAGDDMHVEAAIVADGLIDAIDVVLHLEEGGDYVIERSFTDGRYVGVRNTDFHEHIDIPADAPAGEYHMHFIVTDREGQQSSATAEVDIQTL